MSKGRTLPVEQMTIDQLALRSGVTTRNIRAYQTKGLLPAPRVGTTGRVGIYDASHLSRLRLIARLQDAGFSLAGVARLLGAWDTGETLEQVLGIGEVVESARGTDATFITRGQVAGAMPAGFDLDEAIRAMVAAGALVSVKGGFELRHPLLLELAREAALGGIPTQLMVEELARVSQVLEEIARRFVSHFHRYVSGPYVQAGMPLEQLPALQARLRRLRKLSQHLLTPLMSDALDRETDALMRKLLPKPEGEEGAAAPALGRRPRRRRAT
jgi:DNA-binding transcriptional MerR regulator